MVDLLIIADDFTGALDTGVQFTQRGAATCVVTGPKIAYEKLDDDLRVLSLDAETRHLSPELAYHTVAGIVRGARAHGVKYIYKKTDSALRGNIGAELAALYDMTGRTVHFVPAFPRMNRVVQNGVLYIDGVPVGESVFGRDPFEPVCSSDIKDIITKQTDKKIFKIEDLQHARDLERSEIYLYDAKSVDDMNAIGDELYENGNLNVCAGCAGMAYVLAGKLGFNGSARSVKGLALPEKLLIACGSVNPITVAQLKRAQEKGYSRMLLSTAQKFDKEWLDSAAASECIGRWKRLCEETGVCIIDSNDPDESKATLDYAGEHQISLDDLRTGIANVMAGIVKKLLDDRLDATLLITGGDTLLGFMQAIGADMLRPICELVPGIVLSATEYLGKTYYVISKSGGFGEETLVEDLVRILNRKERR